MKKRFFLNLRPPDGQDGKDRASHHIVEPYHVKSIIWGQRCCIKAKAALNFTHFSHILGVMIQHDANENNTIGN